MRRRRNPEFSEDQIEEIEDRVMNLIQGALISIEMTLNGYEVEQEEWQRAVNSLMRLTTWVRELRPEERRWRR